MISVRFITQRAWDRQLAQIDALVAQFNTGLPRLVSYDEFAAPVENWEAMLGDSGIRPGSIVIISTPKRHDNFYEQFFRAALGEPFSPGQLPDQAVCAPPVHETR